MKAFCKKCLLSEIDADKYYATMFEYIDNLPIDIKTEDGEYKRRLGLCKLCDNLVNGMCIKCGCFVEVRAAKRLNYCPSEDKFW